MLPSPMVLLAIALAFSVLGNAIIGKLYMGERDERVRIQQAFAGFKTQVKAHGERPQRMPRPRTKKTQSERNQPMPLTRPLLLSSILILTACAQTKTVPLAVDCPKPPPIPDVLRAGPVTSATNLSERMESLLRAFEESLTKAQR